jgi:gamma-glutamylcyclotransferase (GGCT)/AIG2-like uncharacterized protein YtfP
MSASNGSTRVFVYGTLLRGQPNHRLLERAMFIGEACTEARFALVDMGPFPAMTGGGATRIVGELYAVDASTLSALDRLEGHPRFYRRQRIRIENAGVAYAYLVTAEQARGLPVIVSGDWRQQQKEKCS